jgi:hypothetical protein
MTDHSVWLLTKQLSSLLFYWACYILHWLDCKGEIASSLEPVNESVIRLSCWGSHWGGTLWITSVELGSSSRSQWKVCYYIHHSSWQLERKDEPQKPKSRVKKLKICPFSLVSRPSRRDIERVSAFFVAVFVGSAANSDEKPIRHCCQDITTRADRPKSLAVQPSFPWCTICSWRYDPALQNRVATAAGAQVTMSNVDSTRQRIFEALRESCSTLSTYTRGSIDRHELAIRLICPKKSIVPISLTQK